MKRVFVDLDDTLVFYNEHGRFQVDGDTEGPYELAHAAKEFLLALRAIPEVELAFFSGGPSHRNVGLVSQIVDEVFSSSTEIPGVFSQHHLVPGDPPKKRLAGLVQGMDVDEAIVVDDTAYYYAAAGEERNFVSVYSCHCPSHKHFAGKVFKARRDNNLVRALGIILWSLDICSAEGCTLGEALSAVQWDSSGRYRHKETNSKRVYDRGLEAMRRFNPELQLLDEEGLGIHPWSSRLLELLNHDEDSHFNGTSFFEPHQVANILCTLYSSVDAHHGETGEAAGVELVEVEIAWAQGSKEYGRLPAGMPAEVIVATLDHMFPVESSGVLTDKHGAEVAKDERLDAARGYRYTVARVSVF
ncbi:hypothetical protein SELMODRAFT_406330 [Selaginella moellendorffii]|uniref:Uncharacterized protein n=1 Tax=Selaginella moellendorffii TaxID=88036 RepID=D8R211_SELML|nr:hypothetical protein SELMODRAFT_406330 [Selaginella moellendorffii]